MPGVLAVHARVLHAGEPGEEPWGCARKTLRMMCRSNPSFVWPAGQRWQVAGGRRQEAGDRRYTQWVMCSQNSGERGLSPLRGRGASLSRMRFHSRAPVAHAPSGPHQLGPS